MARYMGSPGFVSPGAMAGNAIEEFFMRRDALARQQMLDQFTMQQQTEQSSTYCCRSTDKSSSFEIVFVQ